MIVDFTPGVGWEVYVFELNRVQHSEGAGHCGRSQDTRTWRWPNPYLVFHRFLFKGAVRILFQHDSIVALMLTEQSRS